LRTTLRGAYAVLRPVDAARDAEPLYVVSHPPEGDATIWTYLPDGPYDSSEHLRRMLASAETSEDPLYFTIERTPDRRPVGLASYLRITPQSTTAAIGETGVGRLYCGRFGRAWAVSWALWLALGERYAPLLATPAADRDATRQSSPEQEGFQADVTEAERAWEKRALQRAVGVGFGSRFTSIAAG
jgi:hypothetical protein